MRAASGEPARAARRARRRACRRRRAVAADPLTRQAVEPAQALDRASRAAARAMFTDRDVEVTSFQDEGTGRIVYRVADRRQRRGAASVAAGRAAALLRQRPRGAGPSRWWRSRRERRGGRHGRRPEHRQSQRLGRARPGSPARARSSTPRPSWPPPTRPSACRPCGSSSGSRATRPAVAALGELKTLLQNLKDGVAGLRNPPGLLGANENVFETKQAFLTGGGAVPAEELVGVSVENRGGRGQLHARGRPPGHGAQARGPAARRRRPDPGRCLERRCRLRRHARDRPRRRRQGCDRRRRRHVRRRSARGDQRRLRADRRRRPASCRSRRPIGAWC